IIAADSSFDVARFVEGAQAAYNMVLQAFWHGDREALAALADPHVAAAFNPAIDAPERAGHTLDTRLLAIERAAIEDARLRGRLLALAIGLGLGSCVRTPHPPPAPPPPAPPPANAIAAGVRPGGELIGLDDAEIERLWHTFKLTCPSLTTRQDASGLTDPEDW